MTTRREFTQPHLDSDHGLFGRGSCTGVNSRGRDLTERTLQNPVPLRVPQKSPKRKLRGKPSHLLFLEKVG